MFRRYSLRMICVVAALVAVAPATSRAGYIDDLALGLGYIGFDIQGRRMPLSGGIDLLVTRTFVGNPLDFGPWDITVQGPLSFALNTGTLGVHEVEIGINTAPNENVASTPLSFVLNYDLGAQETQITGNLLIDSNIKINNLGFYEVNLAYSSRQTVVRDGMLATDEQDFDFDIGPIAVEGNIYIDLLAAVTQPIFDAAGQPNPFADLAGVSKLNDALEFAFSDLEERLAGALPNPDDLVSGDLVAGAESARLNPIATHAVAAGTVVPEPAMLILMLAGVGILFIRRSRSTN